MRVYTTVNGVKIELNEIIETSQLKYIGHGCNIDFTRYPCYNNDKRNINCGVKNICSIDATMFKIDNF